MIKKYFAKNNKMLGFTLVETLVAISIFSVAILSVMSVLSQGLSNTTYAKQKTIATYLAQEGIEYIRNMRDTYVLYTPADASAGWAAFKAKLETPAPGCLSNDCYYNDAAVDYTRTLQPITSVTLTSCGGTCPELLYDSSTGKYGYTATATTTSSGFIRTIREETFPGDHERKIYSTVCWKQGAAACSANSVTFSENLFDWIEQ